LLGGPLLTLIGGEPVLGDRPSILVVGARGIRGSEGGVEKFAEEFVRRVARDCRVTVLCLTASKPDGIGDVELIVTPRSSVMRTDKIFYYLVAAWTCLTRRFDHVLLLGLNSAMLLVVLRPLFWRTTRVVVRSGSVDYVFDKWGPVSKVYFKLAEGLLRFADAVAAVSPGIQRRLEAAGIRSALIRNGLSIAAAPRPLAKREARHVVAVGRVTPEKNYSLLIEAARLLCDRDVRVTIVGGVDLSGEGRKLRTLIEQAAVSNVTLAGAVDRGRVLQLLSSASLFVNCSLQEGMSNAVLEAIQQGAPIILSDIEANRDLGLPDALYFDSRSPYDLAARIHQALATPSDFVVARERFDDWDDVIDRYRRLMALPCERALAADAPVPQSGRASPTC
jgi:glycosyltransferase involved in cell wall biosynthesis